MKTIGLIGGMSWESTASYYALMNEYVRRALGGLHSAKILLYSVDFAEIERYQSSGEWVRSGEILADAAQRLEKAGADMILIGANTMHKVCDQVQAAISVPIVHIADATADALDGDGVRRVLLLGTGYTMHQEFYKERLIRRGFEVMIPGARDAELVNGVIYHELCVGILREESKQEFARIIAEFKEKGADAVIFGCTEIGLLLGQKDSALKVYDTAVIHAERAAALALQA